MANWAFDHLDLGRRTLSIEPTNTESIATATSAGFTREALLRNRQFIGGVPCDLVVFGRFRQGLADR